MRHPAIWFVAVAALALPSRAAAQSPALPSGMTGAERLEWVVDGNASPKSLGVGVIVAGWNTAVDVPSEWHRDWNGFGRRYLDREAHIGVSNGIEAGLGAAWAEDPRYVRAGGDHVGSRVDDAVRGAFLARRHGQRVPAWARYIAVPASALIENGWLPPSATTGGMTTWRIGSAFIGRALGNLWTEFWPDVRDRLGK
jgi:hypothetical protein